MAVTLRDVAQRAGVSVRTVSNVANDFVYVAPATRARVKAAIEELGYRPNLAARTLRQGHSRTLGIGVPSLAVSYFPELCELLAAEAGRHGYSVIVESTGGHLAEERELVRRPRVTHLVDGLIFSPTALDSDELLALGKGTPLVLLGERIEEGPFDHVGIDNLAATRAAIEHLVGLGRRRVAAIGHQPATGGSTAQVRSVGYRKALRAAGLPFDASLLVPTPRFHRADGARAVEILLDRPDPPDAVFCYNDLLALGALRRARELGFRVPEDLAIVGFDDVDESRYSVPSLTSVSPDKAELARLAVAQLLQRIEGDDSPPVTRSVPYELAVRESTVGPSRRPARRRPRSR